MIKSAWAVKNSVVVICFTVLAVSFGKWWIVLFAGFFTSSLKMGPTVSRVCDGCGKTIYSLDWSEIDEKCKSAGWVRQKNRGEWEDFCPDCQKKGETKQ